MANYCRKIVVLTKALSIGPIFLYCSKLFFNCSEFAALVQVLLTCMNLVFWSRIHMFGPRINSEWPETAKN